jgi:tRNA/tmRNA/rRNA uracil-C5-methylase (TrmA/RlmC/RlmD family)
MAIDLSKGSDKKLKKQAELDGIYLKSRRQNLKLREIIKEMDEALEYLSHNNVNKKTQEAINTILEQRAQATMMLSMSDQATTWLGNQISEEEHGL